MSDLDQLKQKYDEGYRCIYTEKDDATGLTMHLKNFRKEKICTMSVENNMEIGQIENFLDSLNRIKKQKGHDCHDL